MAVNRCDPCCQIGGNMPVAVFQQNALQVLCSILEAVDIEAGDSGNDVANGTNSTGTGIKAAGLLAQFDDTAPTAITENNFGNLRMSGNRNLYVTVRDAAGNERGLNIDATGALAAIVSQATAANLNATVVQPTAANLNATVVQATPGNLNATVVQGTASSLNATVVQATPGNLNATVVQGTASSLNATVVQATASSLNATVVQATASSLNATVVQATATNLKAAVSGPDAHDAALTGSPLLEGFQGLNTDPATVTSGRAVRGVADIMGRQIVVPYSLTTNWFSADLAWNANTDQTVKAAGSGSRHNYITSMQISNSSATPVVFTLKDGAGGASLTSFWVPAASHHSYSFPVPLKGAPATLVAGNTSVAVDTFYCAIQGYTSAP